MREITTYYIEAVKRDGTELCGLIRDDGLQSLWPVEGRDGETVGYLSVLDRILVKEETL